MNDNRDTIKINFKGSWIKGSFCVYDFMDNGHHIAYLPSLNLTGYGESKAEAHDLLMEHVLKDFLDGLFTLSHDNIINELKKLGWEKSKFFHKDFSKAHIDRDGVLKEFNLPAETKIESQLMAVA